MQRPGLSEAIQGDAVVHSGSVSEWLFNFQFKANTRILIILLT